MFQRIFLSATIALPLYWVIALQQTPPLTDSVVRTPDLPEQVHRKIDRKFQDFQQKLQGLRSSFSDR